LAALHYRSNPAQDFAQLDGQSVVVLPLEDLRVEAVHEFKLVMDTTKLRERYSVAFDDLELLVLSRDPVLRRVVLFERRPLSDDVVEVTLDRERLEESSFRGEIPIEFVVGLKRAASLGDSHDRRAGSWIARRRVVLTRESSGPAIPFRRVGAADFEIKGLPRSTGWCLHLFGGGESLVQHCDHLEAAFEVWVHEDIWPSLQELGGTKTDLAVGKMLAASILSEILTTAASALQEQEGGADGPEEGSPLMRILGWLAKRHSGHAIGDLLSRLRRDPVELPPFVWAALDCNGAMKSADFRGIEL
jgi:hypothetical protein